MPGDGDSSTGAADGISVGSAISEVSLKGCGAALVPFPAFDGGALLVAGVKRGGRVLRVLWARA